MNTPKEKQTQSDVQLEIMKQVEKQEVPDLELIIDDQTLDNEANYFLATNPHIEGSTKETVGKISSEDLF